MEGGDSISVQISIFIAIILFVLSLTSVGTLFLLIRNKHEGHKLRQEMELDFLKKTKYLLREQRHDYMNIFQIIYGYLQLNNVDKGMEHIKKAITISSNSSKCYYISIFSISLLLEKKAKLGESKGIEIIFDVDSYVDSEIRNIKDENVIIDCISKLFDFFIDCTYKNKGERKLFIDIYEDIDKIEFVFSGDIDANLLEQRSKAINNIVKIDDGYEVVFYFDKAKDLLLENTIYSMSNSY